MKGFFYIMPKIWKTSKCFVGTFHQASPIISEYSGKTKYAFLIIFSLVKPKFLFTFLVKFTFDNIEKETKIVNKYLVYQYHSGLKSGKSAI